MGVFSKWLLHEDQKDLFEVLFAIVLTIVFVAIALLICWSIGRSSFGFQLLRGYSLLWGFLLIVVAITHRIHEFFKINIYDHGNVFLVSNVLASCLLQIGWSIYIALSIDRFGSGATLIVTTGMYGVAVFSCLVSFYVVSAFYQGHLYRFVSLPLALLTFVIATVWAG